MISCPEEATPHADDLAVGKRVALWPRILEDVTANRLRAVYRGDYRRPYRDDPAARRTLIPRASFLTTTSIIATRGCHNRCEFCYLATDGLHLPYPLVEHSRRRHLKFRARLAARSPISGGSEGRVILKSLPRV